MSGILYIHGFNSSPDSYKARVLQAFVQQRCPAVECRVPQLSDQPQLAMAQLQRIVETWPADRPLALIGSSLGGYYATWLACHYGLRAALLNPAVRPYVLLEAYLGPNENLYTGESYQLTETHLQQLQHLETEPGECYGRLDVYLERGDEVLDYRQAEYKYATSRLHIIAGGNHAFVNFEARLSDILMGLGINCESTET